MTRRVRLLSIGLAAALGLFAAGFVVFAVSVMREPAETVASADGIVALTGGQTRIAEAARLLLEGRGKRLLISGVNQTVSRATLFKLSGLSEETFNCCVDLGYAALDTVGNAAETRRWAEALQYKKLIVVTASYHMPRSLVELHREMPDILLVPHSVQPDILKHRAWWLQPAALRVLAGEYVKFLPAAVRLALVRGIGPWHGTVSASTLAPPS